MRSSAGRRSTLWWRVFAGWCALVALGWGLYLWRGLEAARLEGAQKARFLDAVRRVADTPARPVDERLVPSRERLLSTVAALQGERVSVTARRTTRRWLKAQLGLVGWTCREHRYATGVNLRCHDPADAALSKRVILGAHYDTVAGSPGADDNATGVAAALEVARLHRGARRRIALEIVLFDEEERGALGSRAYAADRGLPDGIAAVVVLEMLGFACSTPGCQQRPPFVPKALFPKGGSFLGAVGNIERIDLLQVARAARLPGSLDVAVLPVLNSGLATPSTRRSDHAPFWDSGIGALLLTDTAELRNGHYHRHSDTLRTLDPVFFENSVRVVSRIVTALTR